MDVGSVISLKIDCMGNKLGSLEVIYEYYSLSDSLLGYSVSEYAENTYG